MTRAFTLIELIAVIVIAAILSALAIPSIGAIGDARSAGAARVVSGTLEYGRETAINSGLHSWVSFDTNANTISLMANAEGTSSYVSATAMTDPRTGKPMVITLGSGDYAGVDLASVSLPKGSVLGFDWLGTPIDVDQQAFSSDATITLSGNVQITVSAMTGEIGIQ